MENDDQIYRGAFVLSLMGGGLVALLVLLGLGVSGVATPFNDGWGGSQFSKAAAGYAMLRLVMGYAVTFLLLVVMRSAGGGLTGNAVTGTAMGLAFVIILLATFLPGWLDSGPPPAASTTHTAFNVFAVTVPHTAGTLVAGWLHRD